MTKNEFAELWTLLRGMDDMLKGLNDLIGRLHLCRVQGSLRGRSNVLRMMA